MSYDILFSVLGVIGAFIVGRAWRQRKTTPTRSVYDPIPPNLANRLEALESRGRYGRLGRVEEKLDVLAESLGSQFVECGSGLTVPYLRIILVPRDARTTASTSTPPPAA